MAGKITEHPKGRPKGHPTSEATKAKWRETRRLNDDRGAPDMRDGWKRKKRKNT